MTSPSHRAEGPVRPGGAAGPARERLPSRERGGEDLADLVGVAGSGKERPSRLPRSLGDDRLGIPLARDGERLRYAYPVAILVADKPAA